MKRWLGENFPEIVLAVSLLSLVGIFAAVIVLSTRDHESFMAECLADHKKAYECRALLSCGR